MKNKKIFLSVLSLTFIVSHSAFAAKLINLRTYETHKLAKHHTLSNLYNSNDTAATNSNKNLRQISQHRSINVLHKRYQQYYKNIPIYGYTVSSHTSKYRTLYSGHYVSEINQDLTNVIPNINISQSIDLAKQYYFDLYNQNATLSTVNFQYAKSKLIIYLDKENYNKARLAYLVNFFVDNNEHSQPARPYFIIDAKNKSLLSSWNGLTNSDVGTGPGGNNKIGFYEYGNDHPKMDVTESEDASECFMTNDYARSVNLNHQTFGYNTYHFPCYRNEGDEINGGISPLNDAHFFGTMVAKMYQSWYHIPVLSSKVIIRVHYGDHYENAFWNGNDINIGDGANTFYPLTSLDVMSHEIAHGFTEQNSNLEYREQSGGLNESFSDMAGKAAEYFVRGRVKWSVGSDITKTMPALRYMDYPTRDNVSIDNVHDYKIGMDVHHSSGIYNKVFYVLATSNNWNVHKAFDVMVQANKSYWEPKATFISAAQGIIDSAIDFGYDTESVNMALQSVGIYCVNNQCFEQSH